MPKSNNPRAFAEVVSIDVWRTEYAGDQATADLHIDVGFFEGRFGGDQSKDSPVRFRLSLKRAEVFVLRDNEKISKIPPSSVVKAPITQSKAKTVVSQEVEAKGAIGVDLKRINSPVNVDAKVAGATAVTKKIEKEEDISEMRFTHRTLDDKSGYVFMISSTDNSKLSGRPWDSDTPRMQLRDTKANRKRGEPPEVTVQIRCKREDLIIEDIEFKDSSIFSFELLSRNKMIAVEQYIKKEILETGIPCGDLSEPFSEIILADAISMEE